MCEARRAEYVRLLDEEGMNFTQAAHAVGVCVLASWRQPHERLCHTPSMNTYGYSSSNGLVRHASISPYTFLSLSLRVWDGILSPHSNCVLLQCLFDRFGSVFP